MSTRTSLGRTSMMVPLTTLPAAKGNAPVCFMASSIVSINNNKLLPYDEPWETWSALGLPRLHCLTDQTLRWQRRLRIRFRVNCFFSAPMNSRKRGVQASSNIGFATVDARQKTNKNGQLGASWHLHWGAPVPGRSSVNKQTGFSKFG